MNIDYLTTSEGHEAVLEQYVAAVFAQTCRASGTYPFPYQLPGYAKCLGSTLVRYFLQQPFVLERAVEFFEKLRRIDREGFNGIRYPLDQWVEATIKEPFFTNEGTKWDVRLVRRPDADAAGLPPDDYLKFMCYVAVCHIKYGPSYASVTAQRYFDMATTLGSQEVARLKAVGSGQLPRALTEYKDDSVSCVANDAFATIRVRVKKEAAESYQRVLRFLNDLLRAGFPGSYSIEFASKQKSWLPIKGLPKKSVQALFANAVGYASLHPLLVEYAGLAMRPDEWYTNLDGEQCAMPSSFAVFALGLVSEAYFDLVRRYMQIVDEEHQSIQEKFTPAFVTRFGITARSLPVFISCILSTQSHKPAKVFAEQFRDAESLELLLNCRRNFGRYLPKEEVPDEPDNSVPDAEEQDDSEQAELEAYQWEAVLYTIFGPEKTYPKLLREADEQLRPLYAELFAK